MSARLLVALLGVSFVQVGYAARLPAHPVGDRAIAGATIVTSFLLMDVTGRLLDAQWDDRDRPLPMGSLIKPFTALAYGEGHRFVYPTLACRGAVDGCWLAAGHGRLGVTAAIAGSCNAYFSQLSRATSLDRLVSTLQWYGVRAVTGATTPASMIGLGDGLKLAPSALARGYVELVTRASQPGVAPILEGLVASGRAGTGRAVGAALDHADVYVKTGTAPCVHVPRSAGDGYALAIYPADRPRVVLLVQAHGRTGADTASAAGALLHRAVEIR